MRKLILGLSLVCLFASSCSSVSETKALLNDVDSYINEAPDSARSVLMAVDSSLLLTPRLRAQYSLLRMMAQDKCYDDITVPGMLDDAAWFERHGTPDERMKLWFYRGRIQLKKEDMKQAAVAFSQAESYAGQVQDMHALGLLYLSTQSVYESVHNGAKEQEYSEKAIDIFKRTGDPLAGPALGMLAKAYLDQQKWELADSVFRVAIPHLESIPAILPSYLWDYASLKLLQPEIDPAGALDLLNRYLEMKKKFGVAQAGAYAYANELLGNRRVTDQILPQLRAVTGLDRYSALIWLTRIDQNRGDLGAALNEVGEIYKTESAIVQKTLEDSVTLALRDDAARQAADARGQLRLSLILAGGIFFALLSAFLLLLLHKGKIEAERKRLVDLREQMQSELERVQGENAEKEQLLSGQEDRIREMEANVARERETYTRERVNRLRQLGELRSTFWWRERGGMREADAIQRIKNEISYVYQTDNNGVALVRRLDEELDGAISELRKKLHLRGKPQEVLFLCCCILDLEPEMIAEIMDTSKANVYEKRSRLRARIRSLGDPLLTVLVEK